MNARGITRVHYDRGWLSVKSSDGTVLLEPIKGPEPQLSDIDDETVESESPPQAWLAYGLFALILSQPPDRAAMLQN